MDEAPTQHQVTTRTVCYMCAEVAIISAVTVLHRTLGDDWPPRWCLCMECYEKGWKAILPSRG